MAASSHKLAIALAARLNAVVPPMFTVRAEGDQVGVYTGAKPLGGSAAAGIVEDQDDRILDQKIVTAILAVLDGIQDCVAEELAEPWPTLPGGEMAMPGARSDGEQVHLWYGDEQAPVITFPLIGFPELEEGT